MDERIKELIKIAHYYYDLGYTQGKIAELLGISRKTVNVSLKRARAEGIVEIHIRGYANSDAELEDRLKELLGLDDAVVIEEAGTTSSFNACVIAYLDKILYDGIYVGINYGNTLSRIFHEPHPASCKDINVVQLGGGSNTNNIAFRAEEITRVFANAYGGRVFNLYMPNIVENKELKALMEKEKAFETMLELYKKLDMTIVAVGSGTRSEILLSSGYISPEEFRSIHDQGAVADICFRFIDQDGEIVDRELEERTTGISTSDMKKVPVRICISYGPEKVIPILSAIRGGFINRLITDRETAQLILRELSPV